MRRTKKRLWLCCSLICLNLAFIWGNSMLSREASATVSEYVQEVINNVLHSTNAGVPAVEEGPLRKFAHFLEFCTLGMLFTWLYGMLLSKPWKRLILPFACGIIAACVDEIIQCFVPGRGPGIKDVGIDTLGVTLGIVIIYFISKKLKSKYLEEQTL